MGYISLGISFLALSISGLTFWMTRIKRGVVRMTKPTVIFFGPDGTGQDKKVFIRTLLYSTSEKGNYVQNMYVNLLKDNQIQIFNIWVYDDKGLVRGSGLFINKSGIASNHHFLMPKDGSAYEFIAGEYTLQVFVETVGNRPKKLFEQKLILTKEQEEEINSKTAGLYFDWAPNTQSYFSHIDKRPNMDNKIENLIKTLPKQKRK